MKKNEGRFDRAVRVAAGLTLLGFTLFGPQTLWGLVGIVPLLTGLFGYCPLYQVVGFNTCEFDT